MKHLFAFLVTFAALPLWAVPFPQDDSNLPPDESVVFGRLNNGMAYAIMPNDEPPERVSLRLLIAAGSLQEDDDQRGLAHYLEHLAFNGSENFPPGELVEYLQRIGMGFGADTNAHVSFNETVYKLELPENNKEMLQTGLTVLRDYADRLLLLEEEVERERGVILSEKRDGDTIGRRTYEAYIEAMFPEARLPKRLPIGTEAFINEAERADFVDYYKTWYRPSRAALIVVGDIEPADVKPLIEETFASFVRETPEPDPIELGDITNPDILAAFHAEPEAPATEVSIMSLREYDGEGDTRAERVNDILTSAANRMISRRLERLAKAEGSPIRSGSAYAYEYLEFIDAAGIDVTTETTEWQPALELAENELRRALKYGFTPDEVDEVSANILNGYERAVEQKEARESRSLSSSLSRSFSRGSVFTSPEEELTIAKEALAKLSPETAHQVLRQQWADEDRFLFITGPIEIEDAPKTIKAAYLESRKTEVSPPEAKETQPWQYRSFGDPTELVDETVHEDIGVTQARFANNVRFNFKQTDFEPGRVLVNVSFGGGELALAPDQRGLASFASSAFVLGGLEAHSFDDIQRIFAGKTVSGSFSVNADAFTSSASTTPDDLSAQLELFAAYLTAPGYREEGTRQARKAFRQRRAQIDQTVEGVLANEVSSFLHSGNFRFGVPTVEEFDAQDMTKLREWLEPFLRDAYLEVSIVGDVDYETAREAVAKTFAALPKRAENAKPYAEARASVEFPSGVDAKTFSYPTKLPRSAAIVYWPTADQSDIQRTRRLGMLSSVFRDRLRKYVREEFGEGYSPFARNRSSEIYDGYGYLFALNFTDPESIDKVEKMLLEIGETLHNAEISADELQRVKLPILKFLDEYQRRNSYWLGQVLSRSQQFPRQLDWARSMKSDYASITADELEALAKKYLEPEAALPVRILPESAEIGAKREDTASTDEAPEESGA